MVKWKLREKIAVADDCPLPRICFLSRRYLSRAVDSDDDMEADADTIQREEARRCVGSCGTPLGGRTTKLTLTFPPSAPGKHERMTDESKSCSPSMTERKQHARGSAWGTDDSIRLHHIIFERPQCRHPHTLSIHATPVHCLLHICTIIPDIFPSCRRMRAPTKADADADALSGIRQSRQSPG